MFDIFCALRDSDKNTIAKAGNNFIESLLKCFRCKIGGIDVENVVSVSIVVCGHKILKYSFGIVK